MTWSEWGILGWRRAPVVGRAVHVPLFISLSTGCLRWIYMGQFRHLKPRFLANITAASDFPFALLFPRQTAWQNYKDTNWGPLSLIRRSGHPCRAKWFFSLSITVLTRHCQWWIFVSRVVLTKTPVAKNVPTLCQSGGLWLEGTPLTKYASDENFFLIRNDIDILYL